MPNYILTRRSVIMCSHGGMVMHVPTSAPTELINGEVPMLLNDLYPVVGCPFSLPGIGMSQCVRVMWTTASLTRSINGSPVLIHTSLGLCQSAAGVTQGSPIIASFQTVETD